MKGWKYAWVDELPVDVYEILIEEMQKIAESGEGPDEDDF